MRKRKGLVSVLVSVVFAGTCVCLRAQEKPCDPNAPSSWVKAYSFQAKPGKVMEPNAENLANAEYVVREQAAWLSSVSNGLLASWLQGKKVTELTIFRNICNNQPGIWLTEAPQQASKSCDSKAKNSWVKAYFFKAKKGEAMKFDAEALANPAYIVAGQAEWLRSMTIPILASRPDGTMVTELTIRRNVCTNEANVEVEELSPGTMQASSASGTTSKKRSFFRLLLIGAPIVLGSLVSLTAGYLTAPFLSFGGSLGSGGVKTEGSSSGSGNVITAEPVLVRKIGYVGTKR